MVWVFFSLSATGNFFELDIRVSQMELESTNILGKCMVKHISCFESVLVCAYIKIVTDIFTNPLFTLPWCFDLAFACSGNDSSIICSKLFPHYTF